MSKRSIETTCIQGGWQPTKGEPRVLPIYQSTTFKYDTSEQMGKLFDLEDSGYFYTRLQNPTNDYVANKICEMEGGVEQCLHLPVRQPTFMLYLIFVKQGIILLFHPRFMAEHLTC